MGWRSGARLPALFVETLRGLPIGAVGGPVRSPAGFHLLKLVDKREGEAFRMQQTRARHILLRPSAQLSAEAAQKRLAGFKQQIESGKASFDQLARDNSEDGSAALGGDLFSQDIPALSITEAIGLIIALLVLIVTFRSFRRANQDRGVGFHPVAIRQPTVTSPNHPGIQPNHVHVVPKSQLLLQ